MSDHTPGRCGCRVVGPLPFHTLYCPTHALAPELAEALREMTWRYIELVASGDCGSWNPEKEEPVKVARALLARLVSQPHPLKEETR